jgi:hypothetical protein
LIDDSKKRQSNLMSKGSKKMVEGSKLLSERSTDKLYTIGRDMTLSKSTQNLQVDRSQFQPKINKKSLNISRDSSVGDILYQDAIDRV